MFRRAARSLAPALDPRCTYLHAVQALLARYPVAAQERVVRKAGGPAPAKMIQMRGPGGSISRLTVRVPSEGLLW
jgi:hypothetical protein